MYAVPNGKDFYVEADEHQLRLRLVLHGPAQHAEEPRGAAVRTIYRRSKFFKRAEIILRSCFWCMAYNDRKVGFGEHSIEDDSGF